MGNIKVLVQTLFKHIHNPADDENTNKVIITIIDHAILYQALFSPFSAELFQVDSSMFKVGRLYFHVIWFLEYIYNSQRNNADFRWDSSLPADSPESALFAKSSILSLALKELIKIGDACYKKSTIFCLCRIFPLWKVQLLETFHSSCTACERITKAHIHVILVGHK